MHVATLEQQCITTIVNIIQKESSIKPCLRDAIHRCSYEVLTHRVFKTLVSKFPVRVNDEILDLFCFGRLERLILRGCVHVTLHGIQLALARCTSVKYLDVSQCDQVLTNGLPPLIVEYAKHLKYLVIENSTVKNDLLQKILDLQIEELSLEGSHGIDDNINTNVIILPFIGSRTSYLTSINVSSCPTVTTMFVRHLTAVHGPTLKTVNISWTNIDCLALIYLAGYTISPKACFTLKDFISINDSTYQSNIAQLFSPKSTVQADDENDCIDPPIKSAHLPFLPGKKIEKSASVYFKDLCAYCSQEVRLRNPSLSPLSSVVDSYEDYDIIASQLVHILDDDRTLTIEEDDVYSDWAILSINDIERLSHCTCAKDNDTSSTSSIVEEQLNSNAEDDAFVCQQAYVAQVKVLDITRIDFFDKDIGWKCFEFFLKSNNELKELYISWSEISNEMLAQISQYLTQLEFLSMVECEHVTNAGLSNLASSATKIRGLEFKGLPFVRDDAFIQLIDANARLRHLSLAESALTDHVLKNLATNLAPQLRHLDLSWCDNITDKGAVQLISKCAELQYLDFRQCNVSEATIHAIACNGYYLTTLGLCGIKGLNDITCEKLLPNLPNLLVIDLSWNSSLTDTSLSLLFNVCTRIRDVTVAGLKRITSRPLLRIISENERWREIRNEIRGHIYASVRMCSVSGEKYRKDEVNHQEKIHPNFFLPHRSVNYASNLSKLTLGYCDKMNDVHLSEIVAVCRGTLVIEDYYGEIIKPCWSGYT